MATRRIERLGVVAMTALATLALAPPAPVHAQGPARGASFSRPAGKVFVPGEIIVKFKPGAAGLVDPSVELQGVRRVGEQAASGGEVLFRLPQAPAGMAAPGAERAVVAQTLEMLQEIRQRADVEYAEPNYLMFPLNTPNDTRYPDQWQYRTRGNGAGQSPGGIGLPEVWQTNTGDAGVVVAVIDTGIAGNHPDIAGSPNQAGGFDMIANDFIANDGDARDDDPTDPGDGVRANECTRFGLGPHGPSPDSWHGTHVAGTIGAGITNNARSVAGVNWKVKVVSVRALGKCGGATLDIADAIRWAAGIPVPGVTKQNIPPARVINMSLGGGGACSQTYQRAIDDAVARGAIVVVAAGNEAMDARDVQPASCENVVTVAASDARGHFADRFSNFGPAVEIMAPGDRILSLVKNGEAFYSGTSMATPHVAGVVALWLARHPDWRHAEVLEALRINAVPRDASNGCPPNRCGAGLLSAKLQSVPGGDSAPLSLSPGSIAIGSRVPEQTVSAALRNGIRREAGRTVSFSVADPAVASVLPAAVTTGATGEASVLVRAVGAGETVLVARSGNASASAPVRVPSGSTWTALIAGLAIAVVELRRRCRAGRS